MADTRARWEELVRAEEKALAQGEEAVAASLARQRLHLLEAALARGEVLPFVAMARTQERLRAQAQALRCTLEQRLAEARQQSRRVRGYRAGAGLVTGAAVAVDRRG